MKLTIKEEFKALIPPLTEEEFAQLEANILKEGIRDSLIVWGDVLIDGHNRYAIAQKHGLVFHTVQKDFQSDQDAKVWMIKNQFGRRNLPAYERAKLALELKDVFAEQGKQNMIEGGKGSVKSRNLKTDKELAKVAGVGEQVIQRVAKIEASATPEIKEKLRRQEISVNKAYQEVKAHEKREVVHQQIAANEESQSYNKDLDVDIFTTDKKFNIIYADPAWRYWEGGEKNQSVHYQTMTLKEICSLPVKNIANDNCILFLWITSPILFDAQKVIESWGFKYSTVGFVWVKKNKKSDSYFFGNGAWTRANAEFCLIATKGSVTRLSASISQVIDAPIMAHSKKPIEVRRKIEQLVGKLPRIELFSRNEDVDGWLNWGNRI